ncbi:MAG: ferredoxin [Sulfitobacter sp.]
MLDKVDRLCTPHGLMAMGGAHVTRDHCAQTIVLVGAAPRFWDHFIQSPEYADGQPDPIDRWSQRIVPQIAGAIGSAEVAYPFGGPPYAPFLAWAKQTGEAFDSPVGMLVHHRAGLMISYRGALVLSGHLPLPTTAEQSPCLSCVPRACMSACPVGALATPQGYDVARCKSHITTSQGSPCKTQGCAARIACPVSQAFDRPAAQSAFHMRAFIGN